MSLASFGGANSFKHGILKRRLDPITIVGGGTAVVSSPAVPVTTRTSLVLSGLSGSLNIIIGGGAVGNVSTSDPAPTQNLPAGAVTMQLVPAMILPSQPRLFGRSVFQDPAALQNQDHPLPQDLPFSWEFQTESDEVWISCIINGPLLASTWGAGAGTAAGKSASNIIIAATIEYVGALDLNERIDIEAAMRALSQVDLRGTSQPVYVATAS